MDRYVAYNDTSSYIDKEDESGEIVRTYDKLLRPGFIGLDRDIYQYATNLGFNFSYGITFRKTFVLALGTSIRIHLKITLQKQRGYQES